MQKSCIQVYTSNSNFIITGLLNKGFFITCGKPIILPRSCSDEVLGNGLLCIKNMISTFKDCDINRDFYQTVSGEKSFRKFSKKHKLVTLFFPDNGKLFFEAYTRLDDGSYAPTENSIKKWLPLSSSSAEIGKCLRELF